MKGSCPAYIASHHKHIVHTREFTRKQDTPQTPNGSIDVAVLG